MVAVGEVDFSDVDQAEAWFEAQSIEVRSAMSCRAALRVVANFRADMGGAPDDLDLSLFRACLISAGRGLGRPADIDWVTLARFAARSAANFTANFAANSAALSARSAARSAANSAARSAANSARSAANFAANFAARSAANSAARSAARSARSAALLATATDAKGLQLLHQTRLWSNVAVPPTIQKNHDDLITAMSADPAWVFWLKFYRGMWEGTFDEWDLAFEVIKIEETDWEQGRAHIAEVIKGIEARLLAERAPLAERIVFDDKSETFTAEPIHLENAPLIQTIIQRVEDCLDDSLNGRNGLRPDESVVTKLRRANSRYSNNPQRLEIDYTAAAASLRRLSDSGEIAETEDNLDLREAVEDGVRALRANHPDIAANRHQLAKLRMAEMGSDAIALLEDAKPVLVALSSGTLQQDFADDIPTLVNDATLPLPTGAPPLPGADEATRIFSRVSRIKLIYDELTERGGTVFDSKGFKTARLGLTISGMLTALVSLGLWIIGVV